MSSNATTFYPSHNVSKVNNYRSKNCLLKYIIWFTILQWNIILQLKSEIQDSELDDEVLFLMSKYSEEEVDISMEINSKQYGIKIL